MVGYARHRGRLCRTASNSGSNGSYCCNPHFATAVPRTSLQRCCWSPRFGLEMVAHGINSRDSSSRNIRIAKIVNASGEIGAHSAGQIIAVDNRYGGVTHVTYGSAKSSWLTHGSNPGPEIVVTQIQLAAERGLSNSTAPVRFAYGNPEIVYHPLLGRWIFAGYRRRVTEAGESTNTFNVIRGRATFLDSPLLSTLGSDGGGDLNRLMLANHPTDETTIAGMLPADPRPVACLKFSNKSHGKRSHWLEDAGSSRPGPNLGSTRRRVLCNADSSKSGNIRRSRLVSARCVYIRRGGDDLGGDSPISRR